MHYFGRRERGMRERCVMVTQLSVVANVVTFGDLCYSFEINNGIGPICYMLVKARHSDRLTRLSARQCTWGYSPFTLSADWNWAHEEAR